MVWFDLGWFGWWLAWLDCVVCSLVYLYFVWLLCGLLVLLVVLHDVVSFSVLLGFVGLFCWVFFVCFECVLFCCWLFCLFCLWLGFDAGGMVLLTVYVLEVEFWFGIVGCFVGWFLFVSVSEFLVFVLDLWFIGGWGGW